METNNKDDWYANSNWSETDKKAFFNKLKRQRYKKAFYLRAKAGYLLTSNDNSKILEALELLEFAIKECPDSDLLSSFLLESARGYVLLNEKEKAIHYFRQTLEVQEDKNKFVRITKAWFDYALFIIRKNEEPIYPEILSVMDNAKIFLEEEEFIKHSLKAIIFHRLNKKTQANEGKLMAQKSLEFEKSEFANKPALGLVEKEKYKDIIELLEKI